MVQRYELTEDFAGNVAVTPVPDCHKGSWVAYEDYAALEDKLAAMKGLLLAAQDFAEFCRKRGVEDWGADDD